MKKIIVRRWPTCQAGRPAIELWMPRSETVPPNPDVVLSSILS
jgi:hypothetical protein